MPHSHSVFFENGFSKIFFVTCFVKLMLLHRFRILKFSFVSVPNYIFASFYFALDFGNLSFRSSARGQRLDRIKKKINVEGLVLNNTRNCPTVKVICHVIRVTPSLGVILRYILAPYLSCQVLVSLLLLFLCFLRRLLCLAAVCKLLRLFILFFFFVVKCRSCER